MKKEEKKDIKTLESENKRLQIIIIIFMGLSLILGTFYFNVICFGAGCENKSPRPLITISSTKTNNDVEKVGEKVNDSLVLSTMEKYYREVYHLHSPSYCGNLDYDDTYYVDNETNDYAKSKDYKTKQELKDYFKNFLSEQFIDENILPKFVEKDNKLYCKILHSSPVAYENDSFEIMEINKTSDKIEVSGKYKTADSQLYPAFEINVKATLIKENNTWVLDKYEELN